MYLQRLRGEGAQHVAVHLGGALEEPFMIGSAGLKANEAVPHICGGLPEVGEAKALVGRAPD